jgi:hypothetical protein
MPTTSPARIDDDLYASAKLAGEVQSRSTSQQVVHWARIGREIEASAAISHREIADVLAGSRSYDSLSPKEQAVVRAEWSVRMDEVRGALDFAEEFAAEGRSWVELDQDGEVVERVARPLAARTTGTTKAKGSGSTGAKAPSKSSKVNGTTRKVNAAAKKSRSRSAG